MTMQVRLTQVDSIPLAVVRRRAGRSEVATVVQQSCGLVWEYLRAQQLRGGRHVAIYWQPEWNADPSRIHTEVFYQVVEPASSSA